MYAGRLAKLVPQDNLQQAQVRARCACACARARVILRVILGHRARRARRSFLLAWRQVEEVLFHLIDLDTLLAPSGKETEPAKKAQLREQLAAGPLLTWFTGLERFAGRNASGWMGALARSQNAPCLLF